jgi:hypothetical protein
MYFLIPCRVLFPMDTFSFKKTSILLNVKIISGDKLAKPTNTVFKIKGGFCGIFLFMTFNTASSANP